LIEEVEDVRWDCIVCGNANYSEVCYGSTSFETTNLFSCLTNLDGTNESIQKPPKPIHASTPERKPRTNKKKCVPLRVINVNCQSIRNKQHQIENMIDSLKPDVIIATETWLDPTITNSQVLPQNFNVFIKERKDKTGDGVLIAIHERYLSSEIPELDVSAEIV
jgi:hypothetical protein